MNVVGPPVTTVSATFLVPDDAQATWNQFPVTLTASLKVTVRSEARTTPVAPFVGVVELTDGAVSATAQGASVVLEFRGAAAAAAKSVLLLSVSVQPFEPRKTAFEVLGAGVGPPPSKHVAVVP